MGLPADDLSPDLKLRHCDQLDRSGYKTNDSDFADP
jgi:hypothetical protein